MSHDLLNRIDQRTRLAGHNRLALLLFRSAATRAVSTGDLLRAAG